MDGYSFVHLLSSGVVIVCVHFGIAHAKKLCLGCKKTHGFVVYSVTHRLRPPPPPPKKSGKIVYLNSGALSRGLSKLIISTVRRDADEDDSVLVQ